MLNRYLYLLLFCLLQIATAQAGTVSGDEVIAAVDQHEDGYTDLTANIEMSLMDGAEAVRVRYLDFYSIESAKIGEKRKFVFQKPRDVKGTVILIDSRVIEDDKQWIFLPAFKRIKRISSRNRKTAFVGSQFSYEDLASQEKEKYRNTLSGETKIGDIACYRVKRIPVYQDSGYAYLMAYVDKARSRYIRIEYFDHNDKRLKTMDISDYKLYQDHFLLASSYKMVDHSNNKTTIMLWNNIKLKNGYSQADFTSNALKRTR